MAGYRVLVVVFSIALLFAAGAAFGDGRSTIGVYLRTANGALVPVCRTDGDTTQCICADTASDAELEQCLGLAPRSLATVEPRETAVIELRHTVEAPGSVP